MRGAPGPRIHAPNALRRAEAEGCFQHCPRKWTCSRGWAESSGELLQRPVLLAEALCVRRVGPSPGSPRDWLGSLQDQRVLHCWQQPALCSSEPEGAETATWPLPPSADPLMPRSACGALRVLQAGACCRQVPEGRGDGSFPISWICPGKCVQNVSRLLPVPEKQPCFLP